LPTQVWLEKAAILPVPCCSVFDAPRYGYRGMLLDVARNFSSKQTVLRLLDVMALYKLNRLHLHLSDDEGWRLAIPELPELTEYGSRRTFSPDEKDGLPPSFGSGASTDSMGSGCYSREDFLEILRYAKARHIMVIPEIDVPGHARAAIKSMEVRYRRLLASGNTAEAAQYLLTDLEDQSVYKSVQGWRDNVICIGLESSYAFIEVVVTALKQMFVEAGAPLHAIHVGGDETPVGCWEKSAQCAAFMQQHGLRDVHVLRDHFYERLRDIFDRNDLVLAGWEEIALLPVALTDTTVKPNPKFVGSRFLPYVWNNALAGNAKGLVREDVAHRLANAGYEIVLCSVTNLYLDLAYEKHPAEPGYYWGGFINARKVYEFCPNEPLTTATVKLNGTPIEPELVARLERLKPEAEHRVLGMQGQLWGENMRSAEILEYFLLPRVVALAERAWAKDPGWHLIEDVTVRNATIAREWNEFANRLGQRELPRMDGFGGGFAYRVPVPGALLRDGMLFANICTPGFVLRYTTDGSEPTPTSPRYEAPVAAGYAKVAAFTSLGRRGRSAIAS
jgi:hexosaminidase